MLREPGLAQNSQPIGRAKIVPEWEANTFPLQLETGVQLPDFPTAHPQHPLPRTRFDRAAVLRFVIAAQLSAADQRLDEVTAAATAFASDQSHHGRADRGA